jgi:nucleoside-diphosphate-sugar epimerase
LYAGSDNIKLGSLTPTRDFNYVGDTVSGFLAVAEAKASVGRVLNVGSGRDISIGSLVHLIFEITGRTADIITDEVRMRPEKSEVHRLLCDASLAKELTGWQPRFSLQEGLEITARWVNDNLDSFAVVTYAI